MQPKPLLRILLAFAFCQSAYAQAPSPPDFSGTWNLNIEKSALPNSNRVETIVVSTSGDVITDGKEKAASADPSSDALRKVHWNGSILIVEFTLRERNVNQRMMSTVVDRRASSRGSYLVTVARLFLRA
jgi:hypothetical protein